MRMLFAFVLALLSQVAIAGLTPLPGSTPQTAPANTYFQPVRILVTDAAGRAVPLAKVSFNVYTLNGYRIEQPAGVTCSIDSVGFCSVQSDGDGVATLPPILASFAGTFDLLVYGGNGTATIRLTVLPLADPFDVQVISGAGQTVVMGAYFPEPIKVRVTRRGVAVPNANGILKFVGPTIAFDRPDPTVDVDRTVFKTGSDGIATTARFRSYSGVGDGVIKVSAFDEEARAWVEVDAGSLSVVNLQGGKSFVVQDMWWAGPSQNGWGLSVAQHDERLFAVVFAYDAAGLPTWYVADGQWLSTPGGIYLGALRSYRSAPYFAYDTRSFAPASVTGSIQLNFSAQDRGQFVARSGVPAKSVDVPMLRLDFTPDVPQAERGVSDMWWGGESQAGWGLSVMEQKGNLFVTWFTYDADGKPTWFAMPEGRWLDAQTWTGPIYRTTSASWFDGYNPKALQVQPVGGFTLTFRDRSQATFEWQIGNAGGRSPLERFGF